MKILVIDDDKESCEILSEFIKKMDHKVDVSYDGKDAIEKIEKNLYDLIVSDVHLPFHKGTDIVKFIREKDIKSRIILISGVDDVIQSINYIELGILDFLIKPIDVKKLAFLVRSLSEKMAEDKTQGESIYKKRIIKIDEVSFSSNYSIYNDFIGEIGIFSEKMYSIYKKLKKLEEFPQIPVLIEGETGTGKEIIAKYIHFENKGNRGEFVAVNCSNLTKDLFDSEIFGYEKGAFTGADEKGKSGKLKISENGTLFLDEITELTSDLQAKLLRVIQEREYYKIGGTKKETVTSRIIASTNRNVAELVSKNLFREDLFFRLSICKVTIPPLNDRSEEIIPLSLFFIKILCNEFGKKISGIENSALNLLKNQKWEGNVRELKNFLTKIILFSDEDTITEKIISETLSQNPETSSIKFDLKDFAMPDKPFSLEELNKLIVKKALEKFKGNKSKAAKFLGLSRIQIYGKYKIE